MPQGSKTPDHIRLLIYGRRRIGASLGEIDASLKAQGIEVSRRTVANIVRDFDTLPDALKERDSYWSWRDSERYGISWDEAARVLAFQGQMTRILPPHYTLHGPLGGGYAVQSTAIIPARLTIRQAQWLARTFPTMDGLKPSDQLRLNERFVFRERRHDLLGHPLDLDDLEAILAFKPWLDDEAERFYMAAVQQGRATGLPDADQELMAAVETAQLLSQELGLDEPTGVWPGAAHTFKLAPADFSIFVLGTVPFINNGLNRVFKTGVIHSEEPIIPESKGT